MLILQVRRVIDMDYQWKIKKTKGTKKTFGHTFSLRHCEFDFSVKIYWSVFSFCWNTMYALKYVSAWLRAGFVQGAESFTSERCAII